MYQYGNVAVEYQKQNPRLKKEKKATTQTKGNIGTEVGTKAKTKSAVATHSVSTLEKLLYVCLVGIVIASSTVILMANAQITEINYQVQKLESETIAIQEKNELLQLEVALLSSPERIMDIAINELGMVMKDSSVRIMSR